MEKEKIIIFEGAQGVGKTTITNTLRHLMPHTNLYRLSGTEDKSVEGKNKAIKMYKSLLAHMKTLEGCSINLLFDRLFFSEEAYCRLGYKEYLFTDVYKELLKELSEMDFEIYYIVLYLEDENEFEKRLKRENKGDVKYAKFSLENSVKQQRVYLELADEIEKEYPNIHVIRCSN